MYVCMYVCMDRWMCVYRRIYICMNYFRLQCVRCIRHGGAGAWGNYTFNSEKKCVQPLPPPHFQSRFAVYDCSFAAICGRRSTAVSKRVVIVNGRYWNQKAQINYCYYH